MSNGTGSSQERDYLGKALDIAVRLTVIAVIVVGSFRIFGPFLVPVVWAIIIAIALYPVFAKLRSVLGDRNRVAGTLFIVVGLALVIAPTGWLTSSIIDGASNAAHELEAGTFTIPPPPEKVQQWPLIGESLFATWHGASVDLDATLDKLAPQVKSVLSGLASTVAGLGVALAQSLIALIIAGILMMTSQGAGRTANSIAYRLAGEDGPEIVNIAVDTIRSVVRGVLLVAIIQSLLAAVGMYIADVPAVGLWALLVLVVAVIQLPPIIILLPVAIWVFANNDSNVIKYGFLLYSLVVSGADGFLKPLLLGRGVRVPMLVILIGAIGGMMQSGVVGLFIGPVILGIGYQLFAAWVADDEAPKGESTAAEPAA